MPLINIGEKNNANYYHAFVSRSWQSAITDFGAVLILGFLMLFFNCKEKSTKNEQVVDLNEDQHLQAVLFNEVHLEDDFWKPRLKIQADTLVPFAMDKTIPAVQNLEKTAKFLKGDTTDLPFPHRYVAYFRICR